MVSTHLKNISKIGNLPQIGMKIKNIWNHQPVIDDWLWNLWNIFPKLSTPLSPKNSLKSRIPFAVFWLEDYIYIYILKSDSCHNFQSSKITNSQVWLVTTLPETNIKSPMKIGRAPKGNTSLPTIHLKVLCHVRFRVPGSLPMAHASCLIQGWRPNYVATWQPWHQRFNAGGEKTPCPTMMATWFLIPI